MPYANKFATVLSIFHRKRFLSISIVKQARLVSVNNFIQEGTAEPMHAHGVSPLSALQNGMDPNGISYVRNVDGGICTNCTVLTTKADVVFANGTRADISSGVYLHHVIFMHIGKSQEQWVSACPEITNSSITPPTTKSANPVASFAGGAIDEFTDWFATKDARKESGYHIASKTSFLMQAELVN
jgi:hypothetical protein